MGKKSLGNLQIYQNALELCDLGWDIYMQLPKSFRFEIGSQFIRAVDSIGANIAEGYGRYHYKDKIKFYYNARGSLWEAKHWLLLLSKRNFINDEKFKHILNKLNTMGKQLNSFIAGTGTPNDK